MVIFMQETLPVSPSITACLKQSIKSDRIPITMLIHTTDGKTRTRIPIGAGYNRVTGMRGCNFP